MTSPTSTINTTGDSFRDLEPSISPESIFVLDSLGFQNTTAVQSATIPLFCSHKDVAVEAVTGSGKTLAFVIPLVEILRRVTPALKPHQVGAVILSPTRELAAQIFSVAQPFVASIPGMTCALLVGGTAVSADVDRLTSDGANVLIGTPGRLDDLLEKARSLDLRKLEVLVLDEADRLLDMGFQSQLTSIIGKLPKQRRTGLFSATQTQAVEELARSGMRNPVTVKVSRKKEAKKKKAEDGGTAAAGPAAKTPEGLTAEYIICEVAEKPSQVVALLAKQKELKTIVYVMTCACVDFWACAFSNLEALKDIPLVALHGKMKQSLRQSALAKFTSLTAGVLLCTDVAARGLDIPGVDSIVQMDAPQDPKAFVHRAGRTARMGRVGNAVVFLSPEEDSYVEYMRLQGVPMQERTKSLDASDITQRLRSAAKSDREVMEKGLRAFVSFFRGYKEHHCNYIFRWKELSLGRLGMAFGLLQLPAMPELKKKPKSGLGFVPIPDLDLESIKYKDKVREKQRQKNNKRKAGETRRIPGQTQQRIPARDQPVELQNRADIAISHKTEEEDANDIDEEYRLMKKLKRGSISEAEFDSATGVSLEEVVKPDVEKKFQAKVKKAKQMAKLVAKPQTKKPSCKKLRNVRRNKKTNSHHKGPSKTKRKH